MKETRRKTKVLLTKLGLDGHDRGAFLVGRALRDAGMEVIYIGRHQSVDQIVSAAIQEDVDILGISSLCDAHNTLVPRIIKKLKEREAQDMLVILGGFIQPEDVPALKEAGVAEVFGIGSKLEAIVDFIHKSVRRQ